MQDDEQPPEPPLIRFPLGRVVVTPGARDAIRAAGQHLSEILARHMAGDWGHLSDGDRAANEASLAHEDDPALRTRILSAYTTKRNTRIWVITEADRSSTCVLLPEEY